MNFLITGHKGMLGNELFSFAKKQGHEVTGFDLPEHDITKRDETIAFIKKTQPDITIHAAAFTAVDRCETEADTAYLVNAEGTENICLAAKELSIPIVYFSTDYIFDGTKPEAYNEDDAPNPQTVLTDGSFMTGSSLPDSPPIGHERSCSNFLYGPSHVAVSVGS